MTPIAFTNYQNAVQYTAFSQVWEEIHYAYRKSTAFRMHRRRPLPNERNFFESMWRIDNLAATRDNEFTNSRNNRLATNVVLILMQVPITTVGVVDTFSTARLPILA